MNRTKTFLSLILVFATQLLSATPPAIVFDFGGVMTGVAKREVVIQFLRDTFNLSETELEKAQLEKKQTIKAGGNDEAFWTEFAKKRGVNFSADELKRVMKESIGVTPEMYALVAELKAKNIPIALLSNIDHRLAQLVREFGFYEPFNPCVLSCEIGIQKPDPQAYTHLLNELHLTSANGVVFVDDRQENIDAALKLGFDAILFESPSQFRQELIKRKVLE